MKSVDLIRERVLELHRMVVDRAREGYERENGKTTAGQFLDVLANRDEFAWLRPFTALLVELEDEELAIWKGRARALLRPDAEGDEFQRRYDQIVQQSPDVIFAHRAAMRALAPD
jgi:hypothetical protein